MIQLITILLILSIVLPIGAYVIMRNRQTKIFTGKKMLTTNIIAFFGVLVVSAALMLTGNMGVSAAGTADTSLNIGLGYIAAALVTGFSTIGAGIAVASAASAALGALSEDPKIMGKALIFVALAEGVALYGLLVSFMILNKLG